MITEEYKMFIIATETDEEKEQLSYVCLGNFKLKECETIEDAKKAIDEKDWELLLNLTSLIAFKTFEKNQQEVNQQKN